MSGRTTDLRRPDGGSERARRQRSVPMLLALLMCVVIGSVLLIPAQASAARYVVENWNPSTGDWHADPSLDFIGWEQFDEDPELLSLHRDGSQGSGLYGHSDLSLLTSNEAVAEWRYTPPGTSTVFKSEYEEATFALAGCLNEGMRLKDGEWEKTVNEGPPFQERHKSYHPTACGAGVVNFPVEGQVIIGNPGPQVFCAEEGEPEPCGLYDSPLENSAAFGIERLGLIQTPFSAYLRGIRVYETSYVKPHFTGATNTIEGWVHTGTGTITPSATESGMGMKTIKLTSLNRNGGTDEKAQSSPCTGTRLARCPATWNKSEPAYSPSFPYSVDELPEGIDHFGVKAVDIVENESLPEGGPDEAVVPPTKVDRTPPANVAATGELAGLANGYINGQGAKTVGVSATDNLSGIRSLSLEDEGRGILATYTPPSCVFTPLREDQCPLQAGETLSVDTGQMPEGANHLRVVAEDLAGNVADGETWTVYLDRTAPSFAMPFEISVVRPPESASPFVLLPDASDPPLADGSPGSGVGSYVYRYSLNGGVFTAWTTSPGPYFEATDGIAGQTIAVEAFATDRVGNQGEVMSASEVIPPEESGPLESEEEQDEEEQEPPEEFIGVMNTTYSYPPSASASAGVSPLVEQPIVCKNFWGWPHPSSHKRTRVNAETRIACEGGPLKGSVRTILYENGRIVRDSGERKFNFLEGFNMHASFANVPCVKGSKWRSFGEIVKIYPPGYTPPEEAENKFSPLRSGPCGGKPSEWHNV